MTIPIPDSIEKILIDAVINNASEVLLTSYDKDLDVHIMVHGSMIASGPPKSFNWDEFRQFSEAIKTQGETFCQGKSYWATYKSELILEVKKCFFLFMLNERSGSSLLSINVSTKKGAFFDPRQWGMEEPHAKLLEKFLLLDSGLLLFCGRESDTLTPLLHSCAQRHAKKRGEVVTVEKEFKKWLPCARQLIPNGTGETMNSMFDQALSNNPSMLIINPWEGPKLIEKTLQKASENHLILAAMTAENGIEALMSLLSQGVDPSLLASGLKGIITQRRIRMNCPFCQDFKPLNKDEQLNLMGNFYIRPGSFYYGKGCRDCHHTGFDAETKIFEVIEATCAFSDLILKKATSEEYQTYLQSKKVPTLRQMALKKAINGQTSIAEALRTT